MKKNIYADNAATTKLDLDAFNAMKPFLLDEYGNASQRYSFALQPKKAIAEARRTIAKCICANPEEIFFTSGGSESDNWAIKGLMLVEHEKTDIITTSFEHHAVLHTCSALEKLKYSVRFLTPTNAGIIIPDDLDSSINESTHLISVMYANNEIGTIQPIKHLCEIAHKHGAIFHTDAVQAVGHVKINVKELGIDMLSASAHKFNGPKGIGFLYIRKEIQISSLINGGNQEFGMRAGTENVAAIVGMAVALKKNDDEMKSISSRLLHQETLLLDGIKSLKFIRNGFDNHIPGNISLSFPGYEGEAILHRMDLCGISISTGSACDSNNLSISHVLKAIGLDDEYAKGTIRISLGKNNSDDDVKEIVKALKMIIS